MRAYVTVKSSCQFITEMFIPIYSPTHTPLQVPDKHTCSHSGSQAPFTTYTKAASQIYSLIIKLNLEIIQLSNDDAHEQSSSWCLPCLRYSWTVEGPGGAGGGTNQGSPPRPQDICSLMEGRNWSLIHLPFFNLYLQQYAGAQRTWVTCPVPPTVNRNYDWACGMCWAWG